MWSILGRRYGRREAPAKVAAGLGANVTILDVNLDRLRRLWMT
jgi:alanine dehydrogenase